MSTESWEISLKNLPITTNVPRKSCDLTNVFIYSDVSKLAGELSKYQRVSFAAYKDRLRGEETIGKVWYAYEICRTAENEWVFLDTAHYPD
jgi:hypothetical protein